jgi:Zn-dependent protease
MVEEAALPSVIAQVVLSAVPILAAIVFHEVAHGAVAYLLGDPTAARLGRLTLNPLPHIDPVGTVLLPGFLLVTAFLMGTSPFVFGWAKPVPVDYRQLRHPRRDAVLVALAGPLTNLGLATLSALVLAAIPSDVEPGSLMHGLGLMAETSVVINCVLAVFNLMPIPPLDGGHVLTAILPAPGVRLLRRVERVGFIIVLLIVLNTSLLSRLVRPLLVFFLRLGR